MTPTLLPARALALLTALAMPAAFAQAPFASGPAVPPVAHAEPHQIVHLSASAQTDVAQDWLVMTLSVQKEGLQAMAVQQQLNDVLSAAMALAKPMAKTDVLELSTGAMNVSPRYDRDGKVNAWMGTAQWVMQGRDGDQIARLASKLQDLTVSQTLWQLSPAQKSATESRIQAEAVALFKSKAQSLTQQFGFAAYTLREVRVSTSDAQSLQAGATMARMAMAQMDEPTPSTVPTLAGKSRVVVNVAGSISMR
jgi:predicted secreted protein